MAINNKIAVYIDGVNRTPSVVLPIKTGNFLDERLDECVLSLRGIGKSNFSPLTPVDIIIDNEFYVQSGANRHTVSSEREEKHFIVADDNATETQIGSGKYNHELTLIEVTKAAECVVTDTLTYTNDIGRNYTDNDILAEPVWE